MKLRLDRRPKLAPTAGDDEPVSRGIEAKVVELLQSEEADEAITRKLEELQKQLETAVERWAELEDQSQKPGNS